MNEPYTVHVHVCISLKKGMPRLALFPVSCSLTCVQYIRFYLLNANQRTKTGEA